MKYCVKCGQPLAEGASFCAQCGAAAYVEPAAQQQAPAVPVDDIGAEKAVLDCYYRMFKYERLAWKIGGIVTLVFAIIFMAFGTLFMLATIAGGAVTTGMGMFYVVYCLTFLPVAIVNLQMVKRAEYYMNIVYTDIRPVIERCSSIGMFILAGFFNEVALIFIIINFVRTKTNKQNLSQIEYRQQSFNAEVQGNDVQQ